MQLSPHFSLAELTFSEIALRQGFDNTPPPEAVQNLTRLALTLLEPARIILGNVPFHINSGYRSHVVNECIGGTSNSAHLEGRAADFFTIGIPILEAFHTLMTHADLPFDQLIIEAGRWIHIAIASEGLEPRREALLASGSPGNWHYIAA